MSFSVKVFNSFEQIAPYKEQWQELLNKSRFAVPFVDFEWIRLWSKHFVSSQQLNFYLIFDDQQRLCGCVPLFKTQMNQVGMRFSVLSFTANSHSFRSDFLAEDSQRTAVLEAWLNTVFARENFDYLLVREFPQDEAFNEMLELKNLAYSLEEPKKPPFIVIEGDWETYFNNRRGHFRRNLRRRLRNAEKEFGPVRYEVFNGPAEELTDVLLQGLQIEASGWKGKAGSAILKSEKVKNFYFDIAQNFYQRGLLHLGRLYFGERLVAFNLSIIYNNAFYLLKIAYDEEVHRYSPGQIMTYLLLQKVFEQKIEVFDFLGPSMPWKLEWTDHFTQHYSLYIYGHSAKARYLYVLNQHLAPRLRKNKLLRKLKNMLGGR